MSQPQIHDTTQVTDSVTGKNVTMSLIDALEAIKRFPARYSFVSDPRVLPATVQQHFLAGGDTLKPAITGAKGGNAALASVIAALVQLGLASDTST
ncbi:MAG: hypothetical protein M3Z96_13020 [Pseudomonadota bacterium]|nr:hypothetical protein [Pseudomonadota bacterium]